MQRLALAPGANYRVVLSLSEILFLALCASSGERLHASFASVFLIPGNPLDSSGPPDKLPVYL